MAIFNSNYQIINLPTGNYTLNDLGDGISASTVHQLVCIQTGSVNVTAIGGGGFTWTPAAIGDTLNIILGGCNVISGEFAGFKAPSNSNQKTVFYS